MPDEETREAERLAPAPPVPESGGGARSLFRLAAFALPAFRRYDARGHEAALAGR